MFSLSGNWINLLWVNLILQLISFLLWLCFSWWILDFTVLQKSFSNVLKRQLLLLLPVLVQRNFTKLVLQYVCFMCVCTYRYRYILYSFHTQFWFWAKKVWMLPFKWYCYVEACRLSGFLLTKFDYHKKCPQSRLYYLLQVFMGFSFVSFTFFLLTLETWIFLWPID